MIRPDGSLRISGEAFAIERLRENPELDYAALRNAANEAGITIQPIQFGRARRQLGLTGPANGDANGAKPASRSADAEHDAGPDREPESAVTEQQEASAAEAVQPDTAPPASSEPVAKSASPKPAAPKAAAPKPAAPKQAQGKSSPAFEFLMEGLRADPTVSYGELKAKADREGFKIAPIMYGRAKALLGLVPVRPRGSGKRKTDKAAKAARAEAAAPSTPRTLKQVESAARSKQDVGKHDRRSEDLMALVQRLEDERRRLRGLLIQIANTIDAALDQDA